MDLYILEPTVQYGAHMDAGDDQTGMRDGYHKSVVIENRYHKYHNVVLSVVLCVVLSRKITLFFLLV